LRQRDLRQVLEVWHRFDRFAIRRPFVRKTGDPAISPSIRCPTFDKPTSTAHALSGSSQGARAIINYASFAANAITADKAADARAKYADIVSPECDQQIERIKTKAMELAAAATTSSRC